MAKVWQQPFVDVFRHFRVGEWKRSAKEGDVAPVTDKTLKCTVYRIRGPVSAGSYVQLPKTSTQSLGLTGRYLYVLFRPLPAKHFVIHLDVATEDSQVIRVSFSNLFKEFKSTATWLQFPFVCEAGFSSGEPAAAAPSGTRWTCLQLDLRDVLLLYLNRRYGHLKSVRLCSSLLVKNLYTSDLCFDPGAWSVRKAQVRPSARPDCYRHFLARYKSPLPAKSVSVSNTGVERLLLKVVVGYNGNGRANVVWKPETGFFAYTCGCLVVVEDLRSGAQRHWLGHPAEISTLALSHGAQVLASASGSLGTASRCHIRIWDVPGGSCRHLLSYHRTAVQALAFSPDDELLVTVGDYGDRTLALWSTATYELLSSARLPEPVHGVAFHPWDAGELVCVGQGAISLWLLQRGGTDVSLQGHRVPIPEEVRAGELTSLCYGAAPLLYCGSNAGQVCVWDTRAGRCFLAWEADDGEIGVLLCSGARLLSGSNTRRLRLWAVGAVAELRCEGSRARSSSVFLERELTLDGAIVSAVFHDSMDVGVVGTTAGTLWHVSWAEGTGTRLISGHRSKVNEVVFSPSTSHWATCSDDGSVRVWSLASMELLIQFQVLNQSCLCLAWSPPSYGRPEQQQVAAGYSDGSLRVFSVTRIAMELRMHPHRAALTALAYSADGQTILSGDKDGLVAVSRPRTGMTFRVLSDHQGALISTIQSTSRENGDFGAEGADLWLAASSDQRISIWAADWPRGCCEVVDWLSSPSPTLTEAPSHPPPCLAAFCPWDGALLVCAGLSEHPELVFYNLRQKQVVERIPLPFFAVSLSLSPGAHLVAVGFAERVLRLVDCRSGAARDLAGHDDVVQRCRFAPSARLLFSVAHGDILVWEVTGHRASERPLGSGPPPD